MRTTIIAAAIAISMTLMPSYAHAQHTRKPTGITNEFPSLMRGIRMLGMGNAFIAMPGTDSFAQYYNPAAINDYEPKRLYSMSIPGANFNPGFFEVVDSLIDLKNELHGTHSAKEKIDFFDSFTSRYTGEYNSFEMAMPLFHVRHKRYAAGFIADDRTVISLRNQSFPNFEFMTQTTVGVIGGSAIGFFDDTLQIGGNIKALFSMGIEDRITTYDVLTSSIKQIIGFDKWNKGVGAGVDFGLKYRLPILKDILSPTIAATVFDIGDTRFTGGVSRLPMNVSAGIGLFPRINDSVFSILFDFTELNRKTTFLRKFHAGIEMNLPEVAKTRISIRGGCNQGYPAFGLSAAWKPVALHFVLYGEEAGEYSHSKGTYRMGAQLDIKL